MINSCCRRISSKDPRAFSVRVGGITDLAGRLYRSFFPLSPTSPDRSPAGNCISLFASFPFALRICVDVDLDGGTVIGELAMMFVPVCFGMCDGSWRILDDVRLDDGISHHDFVDEIYDGCGRLFWLQLGKHVALIVRFVSGFSRHETKAATATENRTSE